MAGNFFDKSTVLNGLYTAMDFGAPSGTDKATFYMPRTVTASGNKDSRGVPFNPDNKRTFGNLVKKTVRCAVEYTIARGKEPTDFGADLDPDKVKITLLDPEWQQVEGFEYVVISGNKYLYWKKEPTIALGSIDVHQVWCKAEDVY